MLKEVEEEVGFKVAETNLRNIEQADEREEVRWRREGGIFVSLTLRGKHNEARGNVTQGGRTGGRAEGV